SPAGGGSWASPATFGTSRRPRPTGPASRPSPLLSLIHVLEWRAAIQPGAIALSDQQGAELTYAGLADAVDRSAAGFAGRGRSRRRRAGHRQEPGRLGDGHARPDPGRGAARGGQLAAGRA